MPDAKVRKGIQFVMTGGTIDSFYDGTKDTVVPNKESVIPAYIKSLKLAEETAFSMVCMKDSRDLHEADLKKVLEVVEESKFKKIIVTHGTYTMPDTARFLKANLKRKDQVIVFVGSFVPIQGFAPSDASFNLGYALAISNYLKEGIYVCMNGRIFNPDEIAKLISEGRFISIFGENTEYDEANQ